MTTKQIDALIEEGQSLDQLAQAYAEIANLKIQKIRTETERNRAFLKEIAGVYALVKKTAIKKGVNLKKPKKMISMVLTSNDAFYGSNNYDLLDFFISSTQNLDTDRMIVGRSAIDYFKVKPLFKNLQQVQLSSDEPAVEELVKLAQSVKDYDQILVFYSSFKSLLKQQPASTLISGAATLTEQASSDKTSQEEFIYIFEPELVKILEFFDNQITSLLLEGVFLESELSRAASRFISMDQADQQANKLIKEYQTLKSYTLRSMRNNLILENFASMFAMRKEIK